jgi:polysaccharide biosynthesis protein PelA
MSISNVIASVFTLCCCAVVYAMMCMASSMAMAQENEMGIESPQKRWVVYYADEHPATVFNEYDIIVFDRVAHPPLQPLHAGHKVILGYISGGEIEQVRDDFEQVKAANVLLKENPHWPGAFAVDVRHPEWTRYLIEDVIPDVLQHGFQGIFIDTLDSVEDLEVNDPVKYAGMIQAAATMVSTIRQHYPDIKIMVNRGFRVMPLIAKDVDYVLAEGILVNYDFEKGNHSLFPDEIYQEYVNKMRQLKKEAPHLQLFTLDYWNMDDEKTVKEIYAKQHANGFFPYVTTIDLDNIHAEPKIIYDEIPFVCVQKVHIVCVAGNLAVSGDGG